MRRKLPWILITALVLAVSFWMPDAVSAAQDRRLAAQTVSREVSSPSLSLTDVDGLLDSLEILRAGGANVALETGRTLDAPAAAQAAGTALAALADGGLFPQELVQNAAFTCTPTLMSTEDGRTAILWYCSYREISSYLTQLVLDDRSGKLLSFYVGFDPYPDGSTVGAPAAGESFIGHGSTTEAWAYRERMQAFLMDYYGVPTVYLDGVDTAVEDWEDPNYDGYVIRLQTFLTDADGRSVEALVELQLLYDTVISWSFQ